MKMRKLMNPSRRLALMEEQTADESLARAEQKALLQSSGANQAEQGDGLMADGSAVE
jgi:hypothetical protein